MPAPLLIAKGKQELTLLPALANRHGLVTGAIGSELGRRVIRGLLGSLLGGKR